MVVHCSYNEVTTVIAVAANAFKMEVEMKFNPYLILEQTYCAITCVIQYRTPEMHDEIAPAADFHLQCNYSQQPRKGRNDAWTANTNCIHDVLHVLIDGGPI